MTKKIYICIEAKSIFGLHKIIITPSVAVNPPAFQYIRGIQKDWIFTKKETDDRLKYFTQFVIVMLSSKDYPNTPICSKNSAIKIAKKYIPKLIKRLYYSEKVSTTFYMD